MISMRELNTYVLLVLIVAGCSKKSSTAPVEQVRKGFNLSSLKVNEKSDGYTYYSVNNSPVIKFSFGAAVDHNSVTNAFSFKNAAGASVSYNSSFENNDSTVVIQPSAVLNPISKYEVDVSTSLQSQSKGTLRTPVSVKLTTVIDSTDKFPQITDSALLTLVQQQTFKYFWDFGHPVSGMSRERNTSGDIVTTGGTGFGVMS